MQRLIDDMVLYHGSYCEVQIPDLKQCAKHKDFGQGFYLTTSKEQAQNFAKMSTRKAIANGTVNETRKYGIVSSFRFQSAKELSIKTFPAADAHWLHCIVSHRRRKVFPELVQDFKHFDIIAGKIANDNTNATITAYMAGVFGSVGSKSADDVCTNLLLPERLQNQYCFRTNEALSCLTFVGSEQIWL